MSEKPISLRTLTEPELFELFKKGKITEGEYVAEMKRRES